MRESVWSLGCGRSVRVVPVVRRHKKCEWGWALSRPPGRPHICLLLHGGVRAWTWGLPPTDAARRGMRIRGQATNRSRVRSVIRSTRQPWGGGGAAAAGAGGAGVRAELTFQLLFIKALAAHLYRPEQEDEDARGDKRAGQRKGCRIRPGGSTTFNCPNYALQDGVVVASRRCPLWLPWLSEGPQITAIKIKRTQD